MRYLPLLITVLFTQSCMTILPDDEWHALQADKAKVEAEAQAKLDKVRFVPSEQIGDCEYINQTSVISQLSFFGGMEKTEENAKEKLKIKAVEMGADSIRISDRLFDKGRGGADSTNLTLYGDLYKCAK
jgi:hypothetical protein